MNIGVSEQPRKESIGKTPIFMPMNELTSLFLLLHQFLLYIADLTDRLLLQAHI